MNRMNREKARKALKERLPVILERGKEKFVGFLIGPPARRDGRFTFSGESEENGKPFVRDVFPNEISLVSEEG